MNHAYVHLGASVVKGREKYGIIPWKVVDLENNELYIFSVGVNPEDINCYGDLLDAANAGAEVDLAGAWDEKSRNAVIKAF